MPDSFNRGTAGVWQAEQLTLYLRAQAGIQSRAPAKLRVPYAAM